MYNDAKMYGMYIGIRTACTANGSIVSMFDANINVPLCNWYWKRKENNSRQKHVATEDTVRVLLLVCVI